MPRIEQTILINAPVEHVYKVARDVESFPEFMADLRSLKVLERNEDNSRTVTEWAGFIPAVKLPMKWTQEDVWNDGTRRDDFHMITGDLKRMEGYWQFTETEAQTRFDSVVDYDIDIPMIGPMIKSLVKKLMTDNLQATLEAIRKRAEESG